MHRKSINACGDRTNISKNKYSKLAIYLVVITEFIITVVYLLHNYSNPDVNRLESFSRDFLGKIWQSILIIIGPISILVDPLRKVIISITSYIIKRWFSLRSNVLKKRNLLNKIRHCINISIRREYCIFWLEMLLLPANLFVISFVTNTFVWLTDLRLSSRNSLSGITVIITLLITVLVIQILQKWINNIRVKLIVLIVTECMLVLMLITFNYKNRQNHSLIMAIVTISITFSLNCFHRVIGKYNENNHYVITIIRSIRYTFLCCYTLKTFFTMEVIDCDWIILGWIVLNSFEYLYAIWYKKREPAEISLLYTDGLCKTARGNLVQYGRDMVIYSLIDNTEEIIHCNKIQEITFGITCKKNVILSSFTKQDKNVICWYSNSKKEEFSNYHFINESWVCFCNICDETRKVKIVNSSDIDTITSTKIDIKQKKKYKLLSIITLPLKVLLDRTQNERK